MLVRTLMLEFYYLNNAIPLHSTGRLWSDTTMIGLFSYLRFLAFFSKFIACRRVESILITMASFTLEMLMENVRMKIPPDKVTNYDHVHLFDENGNPIDVNLNIAGVPGMIASAALAAHGVSTATKGAGNLGSSASDLVQMIKGEGTGDVAKIGENFGKAGTLVENPGTKIDWSKVSTHGMERMNE